MDLDSRLHGLALFSGGSDIFRWQLAEHLVGHDHQRRCQMGFRTAASADAGEIWSPREPGDPLKCGHNPRKRCPENIDSHPSLCIRDITANASASNSIHRLIGNNFWDLFRAGANAV